MYLTLTLDCETLSPAFMPLVKGQTKMTNTYYQTPGEKFYNTSGICPKMSRRQIEEMLTVGEALCAANETVSALRFAPVSPLVISCANKVVGELDRLFTGWRELAVSVYGDAGYFDMVKAWETYAADEPASAKQRTARLWGGNF